MVCLIYRLQLKIVIRTRQVNERLKDEFGGRVVRVRGHAKVMCHLTFGILALTANQMMILVT